MSDAEKVKYILASGSPRRIEMMRAKGYEPVVFPADIDENIPLYHDMYETVMFLALKKAQWVRERLNAEKPAEIETGKASAISANENDLPLQSEQNTDSVDKAAAKEIIIAADTIVYYDGEIMGKPVDAEDGFRMLAKLRNTYHYVVTGVALLDAANGAGKIFTEVTKVWFTDFSDEELNEYLATDEAYDKAGGYAIQGYFSRYIDHIEGDYNNVVGFPWDRISAELTSF